MSESSKCITEEELLRLAEKELLGEAKRAAVRHSVSGPSGWQPCPLPKTNKNFLLNTLKHTISANNIRNKPKIKRKERKLLQKKDITNSAHNFIYKTSDKNKNKSKIGVHVDSKNKRSTNEEMKVKKMCKDKPS